MRDTYQGYVPIVCREGESFLCSCWGRLFEISCGTSPKHGVGGSIFLALVSPPHCVSTCFSCPPYPGSPAGCCSALTNVRPPPPQSSAGRFGAWQSAPRRPGWMRRRQRWRVCQRSPSRAASPCSACWRSGFGRWVRRRHGKNGGGRRV